MTLEDFDTFCASLPHATHVVQWGGAHVWKVGGKVFAFAHDEPALGELHVTFKVSDLGFEIMKDMPGCRPAPYLASRGLKWIQRTAAKSLTDRKLREAVADSHARVAAGLPRKRRLELGFDVREAAPTRMPSKRIAAGGRR